MKLPRDVSGDDLAKALQTFGYQITRQAGSHLRLTTTEGGEHHVTIPRHSLCALARSPLFLTEWLPTPGSAGANC
jgi:predicted RNA binding protein YcfA (HicA-like mRNA interferase family)